MRGVSSAVVSVVAILGLAGCRSNTTYKLPTGVNLPKQRQADAEDLVQFRTSYLAFANQATGYLATKPGGFALPVASAYQTCLTLLAASEGHTYSEISRLIATDAPDEYSLVQGFNDMWYPLQVQPASQVRFGSAVWMIWPTPMESSFQSEMAQRVGSDVVRLGNAGITPHNTVADWLRRFDPNASSPAFTKADPMICTGALWGEVGGDLQPVGNSWAFNSNGLVFMAWKDEGDWSLPAESEVKEACALTTRTYEGGTILPIRGDTDLVPYASSKGLTRLLTGPNDLRHISVEIIPQGDEIGVRAMLQHTSLKVNANGGPVGTGETFRWALFDSRTKLPLAIGRYVP